MPAAQQRAPEDTQQREKDIAMTCPKCKAKIGIVQEKITTLLGPSTGKICYICGYWVQESAHDVGLK